MRSLIVVLLTAPFVTAVDPRLGGPTTYSTPSPNGQFLFVMIAPRPADPHPKMAPEKTPHEKELFDKYAATGSGLYRNDGTTAPLWRVDWYSYRVFPADDGVHLVRLHGDFPLTESGAASRRLSDETVAEQVNAPALSLYANGKLLKAYAVRELVRNPDGLPHSLEHVLWFSDGVMTRDGKQFGLTTQEPRQFYFDLDTGRIAIDREAGLGNAQIWSVRIGIALTLAAGLFLLAIWLYRQRKTKN